MTLDECAPTITNFGDVTAKIQCCATDRCNSFIGKVKFIDMISLVSIFWPAQNNWAQTQEKLSSGVCEQQKCSPACASAQTGQRLSYSLFGKYHI